MVCFGHFDEFAKKLKPVRISITAMRQILDKQQQLFGIDNIHHSS